MKDTYNEWDDARLAKTARRDPLAFDSLYRRYVERIFRYCYARTNDRPDAEDLTAQVFLAALESLGSYRERGNFAGWLFTIARNVCAQHHRTRYTHPELELDESCPVIGFPNAPAGHADLEQAAIRRGILECIRRIFKHLGRDQQEALHLRFWGGLTAAETAQVMDRQTGAIKMLVWRSVNDLRKRCIHDD